MEWKNVNIFISSTFNDMHAERDYLVKYVFPELSEWCDKRKLRLNDIDLRWGVTAEDSRTNRTIGICLRNIDDSRPFFICFLGQRRGWKPGISDVDDATLNEYPDLPKLIGGHSVTEMEIEHALIDPLRRLADGEEIYPGCEERSLIFLRDGGFTKDLTDAQKKVYTNAADADPLEADADLSNFRNSLEQKFPHTKHYSCDFDQNVISPELGGKDTEEGRGRLVNFTSEGRSLKEAVLSGLKEAILKEFPERTDEINTFTEADKRELFAENTAAGYIERPLDLKAVDEYLSGNVNNYLLLSAESGSGKSMLAARTYLKLKAQGKTVFYRSAGTSEDTSDVLSLFSGIFTEAGILPPADTEDLTENIHRFLYPVAAMGAVIVIDALDQIPGGSDVLSWFPAELPKGLKIIMSIRSEMLTGDICPENLENRGVLIYRLSLFNDGDKKRFINDYLYSHFKKLDEEEIEMLLSKKGSGNPLFLKTVVSELRVLGKFEKLKEKISDLGDTPAESFNAILERMENDYIAEGFDSTLTVSRLFSLLSCSRYGLSGKELDTIFKGIFPGKAPEETDSIIRVYLRQLREFLLCFDGVTDIRFSELRRATAARYSELSKESHRMIAECLLKDLGADLSVGARRSYAEAAYHFTMAGSKEAVRLLSDYRFIKAKILSCGITALISDYEFLLQKGGGIMSEGDASLIRDILNALKKSKYILTEKPWEIASQLSMRLSRTVGGRLLNQINTAETSTYIRTLEAASSGEAMTFLDNDEAGTVYVSFTGDGILLVNRNGKAAVISDKDGRVIRNIRAYGEEVNGAFLNGDILYLAQKNGTISAYNVFTARKTASFCDPKEEFFSVLFSDGTVFAGGRKNVYALDEDLKNAKIIGKHSGHVTCLAADETNLWSSGDDGRVIRFDRKTLLKKAVRDLHFGRISVLCAEGGMLLCGRFGQGIHLLNKNDLKVLCSDDSMSDDFTADIKVIDGKVYRFSGSSLRILSDRLKFIAQPDGAAGSFLYTDVKDGRMCYVTASGQVGVVNVEDIESVKARGNGPAELISVNSDSVLIAGAHGGLRLYDRYREEFTVIGGAENEDVTSVASTGDGFLLGRRKGQVMYLSNEGREQNFINYRDSINLDPNMPVSCLCSDSRYAAFERNGQVVCVKVRQHDKLNILKGMSYPDSMLMLNGKLYAAIGNEMRVYDAESLSLLNKFSIPGKCARMVHEKGTIYFANYDCDIVAFDINSGKSRVLFRDGGITDFSVSGGMIAVTDFDMTLRIIKDGKVLASLTFDDVPNSVAMDGNQVFVGMTGGEFLAAEIKIREDCGQGTVKISEQGNEKGKENRSLQSDSRIEIPMPGVERRQPYEEKAAGGAGFGVIAVRAVMAVLFAAAGVAGVSALAGTKALTAGTQSFALLVAAFILTMGIWFAVRLLEAEQSRSYRKMGRIIPGAVLMTLSAVVFYMASRNAALACDAVAAVKLNKLYVSILSLQYLYTLFAVMNLVTKGRVRLIYKVDMITEIYINVAAFIILLVMFLCGK